MKYEVMYEAMYQSYFDSLGEGEEALSFKEYVECLGGDSEREGAC